MSVSFSALLSLFVEGYEVVGCFVGEVAFGKFSWMFGILVVILISLLGLGLVGFPKGLVRLLLGLLQSGALPLGFGVKLGLVRGKYLPAGLLQKLLMFPPRRLVP